ncbi:M43 family zinc metalloprotease [Salmonirosea aquatica]
MRFTKSRVRHTILMFLAFWAVGATAQIIPDSQVNRCGSYERDQQMMLRSAEWRSRRARMDTLISTYLKDRKKLRLTAEEVIRIPVVVHVIHDQAETSIGGVNNPNISDEQIRSQIEVLNEDYRRKPGTLGYNTNPVGADAYIEFYLAEFDPDGRSTTGITRHKYLDKTSFNPFSDDLLLANVAYWPSDKYLNIWTCRLTNSYLGIAQFPSVDKVDGLDTANQPNYLTDGVIIDFRYFGRKTGAITSRVYNLGRTTTHEVAHWLGLIHTWGDAVCGNDFCADTPPTEEPNRTTLCVEKFSNCNGVRTRNMIENYLDYSPDSCMNVFTMDQVGRMRAVLALSPRRVSLVEYSKEGRLDPSDNLVVELYPNPARVELNVDVRFADFQDFNYSIFDLTGRLLARVAYQNVYSRRLKLDVSLLPPGNYMMQVTTQSETITKRFVVN